MSLNVPPALLKCPKTGEQRAVCLCPLCDPEDKRLDAALVQRPRTDGAEKAVRLG